MACTPLVADQQVSEELEGFEDSRQVIYVPYHAALDAGGHGFAQEPLSLGALLTALVLQVKGKVRVRVLKVWVRVRIRVKLRLESGSEVYVGLRVGFRSRSGLGLGLGL